MTNLKNQKLKSFVALIAAITVVAGAFGAHALAENLALASLEVWKTAVIYQFIHILAVLALQAQTRTNYLWLAGILLFSGSLYLLSTSSLHTINLRWLGPITPLGGLCFILGWLSYAYELWPSKPKNGGNA